MIRKLVFRRGHTKKKKNVSGIISGVYELRKFRNHWEIQKEVVVRNRCPFRVITFLNISFTSCHGTKQRRFFINIFI